MAIKISRTPRPVPASPSPSPAAASRHRSRWWFEVLVLGAVYLLYDGVRLLAAGSGTGTAFVNARHVLDLERSFGLTPEQAVNHFVSARPVLAVTLDYSYALLHYLVTPIVLVWLWRRRPWAYADARSALVAATLFGLIGFWLFPTAPPRMMPGFVDTLAEYHRWGWWGGAASAPRGLASLTNEYAAMPSLHVGWAAWCGWQVARHTARRWLRALALAYPAYIFLVVIGTANHYLADGAAGLAVVLAGAWIVRPGAAIGAGRRRAYASP